MGGKGWWKGEEGEEHPEVQKIWRYRLSYPWYGYSHPSAWPYLQAGGAHLSLQPLVLGLGLGCFCPLSATGQPCKHPFGWRLLLSEAHMGRCTGRAGVECVCVCGGTERVQRCSSKEAKESLSDEAMCQTKLGVWAWICCGFVLVCT